MLKKTMTYTNVDGKTVTEDFYFNMTRAELLKLELSETDGFKARIDRLNAMDPNNIDGREVLSIFDGILAESYGRRTNEGKFIKRREFFDEFLASEAYSDLLFELSTDANKAAEFMNSIMPANLAEEVDKALAEAKRTIQDVNPLEVSVHTEPNPLNMTEAELREALGAYEPDEKRTNGLTDEEIRQLTPAELTRQPREVLLQAYRLKNKK